MTTTATTDAYARDADTYTGKPVAAGTPLTFEQWQEAFIMMDRLAELRRQERARQRPRRRRSPLARLKRLAAMLQRLIAREEAREAAEQQKQAEREKGAEREEQAKRVGAVGTPSRRRGGVACRSRRDMDAAYGVPSSRSRKGLGEWSRPRKGAGATFNEYEFGNGSGNDYEYKFENGYEYASELEYAPSDWRPGLEQYENEYGPPSRRGFIANDDNSMTPRSRPRKGAGATFNEYESENGNDYGYEFGNGYDYENGNDYAPESESSNNMKTNTGRRRVGGSSQTMTIP